MGVLCLYIMFRYIMMQHANNGFFCKIPSQTPWCPSLGKGWQAAGLWWPAACTLYTSTAPSGWWQNHILPPEEQKCHKVRELENTSPIRVAVGHVSIEEIIGCEWDAISDLWQSFHLGKGGFWFYLLRLVKVPGVTTLSIEDVFRLFYHSQNADKSNPWP